MRKVFSIILFSLIVQLGFSTPIDTLYSRLSSLGIDQQFQLLGNLSFDFVVSNNREIIPILKKYEQHEFSKKNPALLAKIYYQLSLACYFNGKYDENYMYGLKAIQLFDSLGNFKELGTMYGELGYQMKRRDLPMAFELMQKGISILESNCHEFDLTNIYNNYGVLHEISGNADSAIFFYRKSLLLKKKQNDTYGTPFSLNNIASVFIQTEKYDSSLRYLNESTKIRVKISDTIGLAENFSLYGQIYTNLGSFDNAIENYHKALKITTEHNYTFLTKTIYQQLSEIYEYQQNYEKAFYYHKLFKQFEDSLVNLETNKTIANLQVQFETEKKQQEIDKQQLIIENQTIESRRRLIQRNFLIGGSSLLALLVFMIFIAYRQKIKANSIISEKNVMLQQANEEISSQRDEIEAQRDIVLEQKERIEKQKKDIDDSIHYAQRIQTAVIPSGIQLSSLLNKHFVIFRPKDVLSGDFFWATRINKWIIVTVADCTGHGIPGAFMSMLGVSFLNEIVRKKEITTPAQVLKELRELIVESLHQSIDWNSQKDGMDMSLVAIDSESGKCLWAGAGIPLWIVKKENVSNANINPDETVEIIKADCMSVSINQLMNDFTNHEFQLSKGDRIYLLSDGITDQFGGPNGKKFMGRQLKRIIVQSAKQNLSEQKQSIENALASWLNPSTGKVYDQVDDITVLGIEL